MSDFLMPEFFSDGMLFEQNKPINIWGKAVCGSAVSARLTDAENKAVCSGESTADDNGDWRMSLCPLEGSYMRYTMVISVDGVEQKTINDILIGVLWLASGQSNMEYALARSVGGREYMNTASDEYLRVLHVPNCIAHNMAHPAYPIFDVPGSTWISGDEGEKLAGVSALAYHACKKMRESLDMPVGFINSSMGATNIQTWISREEIEENDFVKSCLVADGIYKTVEDFETSELNAFTMTALYNIKIAPLKGMNISGVMWYQGESNVDGLPNTYGYYKEALKCLVSCFADVFCADKNTIPFIVMSLASHPYRNDPQSVAKWIEQVNDVCSEMNNVVNIPLHDAPLTYTDQLHNENSYSIHPNDKRLPALRTALSALHNVYKVLPGEYYTPVVESYETEGDRILVKFKNTADGLCTLDSGDTVRGFTIADKDGVFTPAYARIVSKDTVELYNPCIEKPCDFTYAFNSHSPSANLCNSQMIPATLYRSDRDMTNFVAPNDWMYCESTAVDVNDGRFVTPQTTWHAVYGGKVAVDNGIKHCAKGSIKFEYTCNATDNTAMMGVCINHFYMPAHLSRYKGISFMIRNDQQREKFVSLCVEAGCGIAVIKREDKWTHLSSNDGFERVEFSFEGVNAELLEAANRITLTVKDVSDGSIHVDDVMLLV